MHDFYSGKIEKAAAEKTEPLPSNEDASTEGMMHLYDNPPGRESGNIDAPWGEAPHPDPNHNGDAAWKLHLDTRFGTLKRLFDGKENAKDVDQALVQQYFEHGKPGEYETRAALLHKEAQALQPEGATLTERVRKLGL